MEAPSASASGDGGDGAGSGSEKEMEMGEESNDNDATDAGPSFVFSVDADDGSGNHPNEGIKLLTQALEEDGAGGDDSSNDGSSDDSSEGSGSDDESACNEPTTEAEVLERRDKRIRRHEAFKRGMDIRDREQLDAMSRGLRRDSHQRPKRKATEAVEVIGANATDAGADESGTVLKKRRGMIFTISSSDYPGKNAASTSIANPSSIARSLVDELTPNFPHRERQIRALCSLLVATVQKSKLAWKIDENDCSSGNAHYSPSPILITGSGGTGKTSIVRRALEALRKRTNVDSESNGFRPVADAYVDCASSDSGSFASVVDSAYRQLYACSYPGGFGEVKKGEKNGKRSRHASGIKHPMENDFTGDFEGDADDEVVDTEEFLERQRKRKAGALEKQTKKEASAAKLKANKTNVQQNVRRTRSQTARASQEASKVTPEKASLHESTQGTTTNVHNSSSAAFFGRATSILLQGNATKKQSSVNWRCAFLVLDNADRILSWNKRGAPCPLAQLFILPGVLGINLTLIFISRSVIFETHPLHRPPEAIIDAVHPQLIQFNSYRDIEVIKSILHVPRVQKSITGSCTSSNQVFRCPVASMLRSKLNDLLYTSMINTFVPSVKSSTKDISETMRLARLLWPEYVAPLEQIDGEDPTLKNLVWQSLLHLYHGDEQLSEQCNNSNCSYCRCLSMETDENVMNIDQNIIRQRLSEKLDKRIRETMRRLLSTVASMPGRVLNNHDVEPPAKMLPYTTKFLLIAAFLCQSKRPEQDINLYTTKNTGKSKKNRSNTQDDGSAYVSSYKELKQRQPSFPLERMLTVFRSIIEQYGQHFMTHEEEGVPIVAQLGTDSLFKSISELIEMGLLKSAYGEGFDRALMEMTSARFSCTISRDDASHMATSVGFPLEKYCQAI